VRRFHVLKTEWGIAKFFDKDTFYDSSNGYLMDDTCVFGVEVFVVKSTNKGDCLSIFPGPITCSYSWKFSNFSSAKLDKYESETFVGGNYKGYCIQMLLTFSTCMCLTWDQMCLGFWKIWFRFVFFFFFFYLRNLLLYVNGGGEGKGNSVSLFLELDVSTLPANTKLVVELIVRAKDQKSGGHAQNKGEAKISDFYISLCKFRCNPIFL